MPLTKPTGVATQSVQSDQIKALQKQNEILLEQTQLLRKFHSLFAEYMTIMKGPTIGNGLGSPALGPRQSNPRG